MKLFFYDLETTGVTPRKHGIHQISGLIDIDGEVKEIFDFKVRPHPDAIIDEEALRIAGVTREQIKSYPPMQVVFAQLSIILSKYVNKYDPKDKFFSVGFNILAFDNQHLRVWFEQNADMYFGSWFWSDSHDVFALASKKLAPYRHLMENFKLKTVCKQMGIEVDETRLHDAAYDMDLTRQLYYKL